MTRITIEIDEDYIEQLKRRLDEYRISHGALARQSGISETQLSRWFNTGIRPRLSSIVKIEKAVAELRAKHVRDRSGPGSGRK